ncbi:HelD family protein [Geodermatophilus ruber]|uniref:DNA helicase IV n=1 Tax=Geodermatophilus ruber TaxID=504800 RepID=A0A1I4H665_9ACTN|nr:AAA family ATPase [Geodermatophilus ruber]SFL37822.1 DNA helicase IV [Geodermatophilus ruber]
MTQVLPRVTGDPSEHPDMPYEQAYISRAYQLLDRGLATAEHTYNTYDELNRSTASALKRSLEILKNARGAGQLVVGRMDRDGETLYVGVRRVHDEHKDLVVASWHAPAVVPYYEATPQDPQGIELKRVFVEEDRVLKSVVDEIVSRAAADVTDPDATAPSSVSDALLNELDRSRDGAMREVVATIQSEQFRIIRAERDVVLVVQGGPGTGKTVVGLHRAAYLAFNDEKLRREGMLVVAPNQAFLSYISGVLPSLDASDILQIDLASLYTGEAGVVATEDVDVARIKGSAAMVTVLRRALQARTGWGSGNLEFSLGGARTTLPGSRIQELIADVERRNLPHNRAREVLRQSLSAAAYEAYRTAQNAAGRAVIATESSIRRLSTFTNALDRMWPSFTPEDLLRSLYGTQSWLVYVTEGVLSADERALLYREPRENISEEPWTVSDLFCLDELAHRLNGELRTYGHIVVDEAQDLSPMQARALARRCPSGSFTVLGDLAQATGPWVRDSWDELTDHLASTEVRVETLSIGYRVPGPVLDLAARLLPLISPGLTAPRSVRQGAGEPSVHLDDVVPDVDRAIELAAEDVRAGLTTALIVPDDRYDECVRRCRSAGLSVGDGRDGDFASDLTVVPATAAKGLEFDSVVLLRPTQVVGASIDGRRVLYVAMTRCTQQLRLVEEDQLPEGLRHLLPPTEADDELDVLEWDQAPDAELDRIIRLLAELSPEDLELVGSLVRRLSSKDGNHQRD